VSRLPHARSRHRETPPFPGAPNARPTAPAPPSAPLPAAFFMVRPLIGGVKQIRAAGVVSAAHEASALMLLECGVSLKK